MDIKQKNAKVGELESTPLMGDLGRILLTKEEIQSRIEALGREISRDYQGRELVLVGILKGSLFFLADLTREIMVPHQFDLVGAQSYRGTQPGGKVNITKDIDLELHGKDVLLIEDVYDSGSTLHVILEMLKMHKPHSLEIAALLYKKKNRERPLPIKYVGFEIDDIFVVGYGLDYKENYRHLKCIGVLHPEVYE